MVGFLILYRVYAMAQAQQQGGGGDNSLAPVWITVLLFITAYLIWYFAHQYIVAVVFFLNIIQAKLVTLFISSKDLQSSISLMQTLDPKAVDWEQLAFLTSRVGEYTRYPVIIALVILSFILYKSNIVLRFRKAHNMKTLRAQEQQNWFAIMPIVKEDLTKADINQGPWAMALTPLEFASKYRLLKKQDPLLDQPAEGFAMTAGIHAGEAKRVFTLQLGPYWDGFESCSPQAAALAAVFISRINRDRDSATLILETLSRTYAKGKINYAIARPTLEKYKNTEIVQEITQSHAFMLTVLASLIEEARKDGVVPCAEFIWLKPVDRRLWYMLNCVGRQTPFAEVAGPFAHWRAEKLLNRRSLSPMIDEAVTALETAIKEVKLTEKQLKELEP